ncbi:HMG1/2-like protein [Capsicum annuum]
MLSLFTFNSSYWPNFIFLESWWIWLFLFVCTVKQRNQQQRKKRNQQSQRLKGKRNPNAPKRPPTALFVFMDEFRQTFKAANPHCKRVSTIVLNSVVPNNNLLLPLYPFSFI